MIAIFEESFFWRLRYNNELFLVVAKALLSRSRPTVRPICCSVWMDISSCLVSTFMELGALVVDFSFAQTPYGHEIILENA